MVNSYRYTPEGALKTICYLCEEAYSKGKRKININQIWSIADNGLRYEYDTTPVGSFNSPNLKNNEVLN